VVGDAKKAKGFAQQRTGAFLLTLGGLRSAERSEGNPQQKKPRTKGPGL